MSSTTSTLPAPLVAAAGWVCPGLGYFLIGQRARGITVFCSILILFTLGLLIAGIRVVDVPGYGDDGKPVMIAVRGDSLGRAVEYRSSAPGARWVAADPSSRWILTTHPFDEVLNKPWYIGQILAGPVTLVCSKLSLNLSAPLASDPDSSIAAKSHVRVAEIGTLYTAVAGMLNLLVIIDAAHRANRKETAA